MGLAAIAKLRPHGTRATGLALVLALIAGALVAPVFAPYDPFAYATDAFQPPSWRFWLGSNDVGQDILSQLLHGARTSILVGVGVASLATTLSAVGGTLSALIGGLFDRVMMRVVDALIVIPDIVVIILVAAYLRPNLLLLVVLLSLLGWQGGARVLRSQALSLKERMHVQAARTFGAGTIYVLRRHVVPELGPILLAGWIQGLRRAVFMEAGLSFLGISDPGVVSWGKMMHQALNFAYLEVWKWWLLPPGIALSLVLVAFVLVGYWLEQVMFPRLGEMNSA